MSVALIAFVALSCHLCAITIPCLLRKRLGVLLVSSFQFTISLVRMKMASPMRLLLAPPSTPIRTVSDTSSSSIDDELAKAADDSLSMGTSIVKDMNNISFVLPPRHKLHPNLYINTTHDDDATSPTAVTNSLNCHLASMQLTTDDKNESCNNRGEISAAGVPGFPDFPNCWAGQPSTPKASNRNSNKQRNKFSRSNKGQQRRCHRRIRRIPVNVPFGAVPSPSSSSSPSKEMKRMSRDARKLRRMVKAVQLKERRRRKKDMGDICRGIAAIKW